MNELDFMVRVNCITYNHARYIEDAMNGFCMQKTSFPFVCVIVDDASTDGEPEVINNYLQVHFMMEDKSVVRNEETEEYFLTFAQHNTNPNCFFAVFLLKYNHFVIKKSKKPYFEKFNNSKYIAMCEGDDFWRNSKKLQMQVDELESNPSHVLCYTNYVALLEDGRFENANITDLPGNDNYSMSQIIKGNKIATLTVLYSADAYKKIPRLFSTKLKMSDLPLWIELSQVGLFKYIPEVTAVYRILSNSASHSTDINKRVDFIRSTFEIKKFYADYYQKNLKSNYLETKMYEALLNEAFLSKDIELSRALFKEAKSRNINSFDLWKTYILTAYPTNPLVLLYLNLRKRIK